MKKLSCLIVLVLILGLALAGCTFLSNIGQAPATDQSGITYLTKGGPGPDPTLVGLWHFDGGSGITASDSSGNFNDGDLMGDTSWTNSGKFGNALSFNGINGYVSVDDADILDITDELTIEAWIVANVNNTYKSIVVKGDAFSEKIINYGLHIQAEVNPGTLRFFVFYGGSYKFVNSTSQVPTDDKWHHVAVTVNTTTDIVKFYIDGLPAGIPTFTASLPISTSTLEIGRHRHFSSSASQYFDGKIDEVRIWNRALDEGEILDNFNLSKVLIDIKPGSYPNSINLGSNGVVPVAILGSAVFDATTVDPLTVTLAGSEVKVKGHSGNSGSLEDVDGDGFLDLVVQVYTENLDLITGDLDAVLNAYTYAGPALTGSDSIRIVPQE